MNSFPVKNIADVSKVISLEPLDPDDGRYTDLSKARSTRDLLKLRRYLENNVASGSWASAAFIGHRGSGKSTELKKLEGDMAGQFTSLHLMVDNSLQQDCDYTDLLLWLVDSVVNHFDAQKLPLDPAKAKAVADWFAERTIETAEALKKEISIETEAEAKAKTGFDIGILALVENVDLYLSALVL